jgi:hypothetical protein
MAILGGRRGVARLAMALVGGLFCIVLTAEAAPLSDTPPDPHGVPTVYRSEALDAYAKVTIGWLPAPFTLTAAEQAPEATALAIINRRMAEVGAALEKKKITIGALDMTVVPENLHVTLSGLLPDNRRIICATISPGNKMYSTVIMSVDRDAPLVDPREVWDEDGNRAGKGALAQFVTETLRVNTWEQDTFEGVRLRMCQGNS